jgi:hypothetical protein
MIGEVDQDNEILPTSVEQSSNYPIYYMMISIRTKRSYFMFCSFQWQRPSTSRKIFVSNFVSLIVPMARLLYMVLFTEGIIRENPNVQ